MPTSGNLNYDASITNEKRSVQIYKDLNLNFGRHPVTKQVQTLTDASAVKRSVRNLVQIGEYEKPFHPEIASGVRDMLFENMTPFTAQTLSTKIKEVIENHEPRALLANINVVPRFDENQYEVTVEFYIQNAPAELVDLSFTLERLR